MKSRNQNRTLKKRKKPNKNNNEIKKNKPKTKIHAWREKMYQRITKRSKNPKGEITSLRKKKIHTLNKNLHMQHKTWTEEGRNQEETKNNDLRFQE